MSFGKLGNSPNDRASRARFPSKYIVYLSAQALSKEVLDSVFNKWWPELEKNVQDELEKSVRSDTSEVRSEKDLLEEILQLTRLISRKPQGSAFSPAAIEDLVANYARLAAEAQTEIASDTFVSTLVKMGKPLRFMVRRIGMPNAQVRLIENQIRKVNVDLSEFIEQKADRSVEIREEDFDNIPF